MKKITKNGHTYNFPDDTSDLDIEEFLNSGNVYGRFPTDRIGSTISNIPGSAKNIFQSIIEMMSSPIETAKGIGGLAAGAVQEGAKSFGADLGDSYIPNLNAYTDDIASKFGSMEAIQDNLEADPLDMLSMILGSGAIKKVRTNRGLGAGSRVVNLNDFKKRQRLDVKSKFFNENADFTPEELTFLKNRSNDAYDRYNDILRGQEYAEKNKWAYKSLVKYYLENFDNGMYDYISPTIVNTRKLNIPGTK